MIVNERFFLNDETVDTLADMEPQFGYDGFGEIVFNRTYSRLLPDHRQEKWFDVVLRNINGTMSIRKDHYVKNQIEWDEKRWQKIAHDMAISLFKMEWMPAGRGLWAMGTKFIYERGSMALNNCGFVKIGSNDTISNDFNWMMDALMLGVGVGFEAVRDDLKIYQPQGEFIHYVADSREGWANSWSMLIDAFTKPGCRLPRFKYDLVREKGRPIRGFGGKASGPGPLIEFHRQTEEVFRRPNVDVVRLKADLGNMCGVCVVAGNVRRSAELLKGQIIDPIFLGLKDYDANPEREEYGYMSNNTVALETDEDFESLGEVARRVIVRGEPGIMNLRNFKYGRISKREQMREDKADGLNPCGEIPLESFELCNVVETLPTVCLSTDAWLKACEYATSYATTVSLLPTHRVETNRVVVRNRRIGVSIIDWTGWVHTAALHNVTRHMRKGYQLIVERAAASNAEAGVPAPIRHTTIKPGGTTPKLPGKTPGIGYPTFKHTLRRMRVANNNPICPILDRANVPSEPEFFDPKGTRVYEYPMIQGPTDTAENISLWQQATNLATVQREWSDNAVSNTLYFKPYWKLEWHRQTYFQWSEISTKTVEEQIQMNYDQLFTVMEEFPGYGDGLVNDVISKVNLNFRDSGLPFKLGSRKVTKLIDKKVKLKIVLNKYNNFEISLYSFDPQHEEEMIEPVLASFVPLWKSASLLPHSGKGAYRQMPEEGITEYEYLKRKEAISKIDWTDFKDSDGEEEKFCSGPACEVQLGAK